MSHSSRRRWLGSASAALLVPVLEAKPAARYVTEPHETLELDLGGEWKFRTDSAGANHWSTVTVPHTFQIEDGLTEYRGLAWYQREFTIPEDWRDATVRIEFEAVFHSAKVSINGKPAGSHLRKGYTAFAIDITSLLIPDKPNVVTVQTDNRFDEHMLPRGRSSDWAHDGGIYRPVRLLATPSVYIERIAVDAVPDFITSDAHVKVKAYLRNATSVPSIEAVVRDASQNPVAVFTSAKPVGEAFSLEGTLTKPTLWHFDHPYLYTLEVRIPTHRASTTFGVRQLAVKGGTFLFNNEPVRLMGVERMAGSNPEFGMAEPGSWIDHDHDDLKELNCVFTRVHWPQDRRVLDYCDRHGILLQSEVPTWGPKTFANMGSEPDADIMQNGLDQFHEMLARDGNHPCIISWGLCNEIGGQNPPAYNFARHMLAEAKRLDPHRLCSYASHSLFHDQAKDVSGLMDFIECNEYIGSWQKGGTPELVRLLDEIHAAFPDKAVVLSEYGYCACTADRPEGDGHRQQVMVDQDAVLRTKPFVAGAIFFCYNDYRTHVGDRGTGVMKQRVHGVVDLYGGRKPSFTDLRIESSPIDKLTLTNTGDSIAIELATRVTLPAYTLRNYSLRAVFYGPGDIPIERKSVKLPELAPGKQHRLSLALSNPPPQRVQFDILRPNGFSVYTSQWHL